MAQLTTRPSMHRTKFPERLIGSTSALAKIFEPLITLQNVMFPVPTRRKMTRICQAAGRWSQPGPRLEDHRVEIYRNFTTAASLYTLGCMHLRDADRCIERSSPVFRVGIGE